MDFVNEGKRLEGVLRAYCFLKTRGAGVIARHSSIRNGEMSGDRFCKPFGIVGLPAFDGVARASVIRGGVLAEMAAGNGSATKSP